MVNRIVVNGCSYMNYYARGNGHIDLAKKFQIQTAESLAQNGSCNKRIIRTTLRDCYQTTVPTLYVIGTSFLTRYELPAASGSPEPDGKWVSFSRGGMSMKVNQVDNQFTQKNVKEFHDLYDKFTVLGLPDLTEDLMYAIVALIDACKTRGHSVVAFNTAEHTVEYFLDESRFDLFRERKEIIQGFKWRSIPWQFEQGASYCEEDQKYPWNCRHVALGDHQYLNDFLYNYIQEHKILQ
jgi:hypothetical protein